MNAVCLEVLDRFQQFLEGTPKARNAETVAGAGMVDQLAQSGSLDLPSGNYVDEDADGTGLAQVVFLGAAAQARGRHATRRHSRGCLPYEPPCPSF